MLVDGRGARGGRGRGGEEVGLGFVGEGDGLGFQFLQRFGGDIEQVLAGAIGGAAASSGWRQDVFHESGDFFRGRRDGLARVPADGRRW